jgi:hypothetical protein
MASLDLRHASAATLEVISRTTNSEVLDDILVFFKTSYQLNLRRPALASPCGATVIRVLLGWWSVVGIVVIGRMNSASSLRRRECRSQARLRLRSRVNVGMSLNVV